MADAYAFDGESYEKVVEATRITLGTAGNRKGPYGSEAPHVPRGTTHRAVYVTSGTPTSGRYPMKLQWRFESEPEWKDFIDPATGDPITGWAIAFDDAALEANKRYAGMQVSVHPGDRLPVFAVVKPGSGGAFSGVRLITDGTPPFTITGGGTTDLVTWDANVEYDTDSYWSAAQSSKFFVPATGKYRCTCALDCTLGANQVFYAWFAVSGGGFYGLTSVSGVTGSPYMNVCFSTDLPLGAGAYVEVYCKKTGAGAGSASNAEISIQWLNPSSGGGGAGTGTVTSVGLSMPSDFTVTGSPVTTSGTLAAAWASGGGPTTVDDGEWT